MNKDINDYTLKEFREMENFGEDRIFNSIIIVPMNRKHESGYTCMKFILLFNRDIVGVVGGWCDITYPTIKDISIRVDCLKKSKCVRLMFNEDYIVQPPVWDSFYFDRYEEERPKYTSLSQKW